MSNSERGMFDSMVFCARDPRMVCGIATYLKQEGVTEREMGQHRCETVATKAFDALDLDEAASLVFVGEELTPRDLCINTLGQRITKAATAQAVGWKPEDN